jgi:hypothetical protein
MHVAQSVQRFWDYDMHKTISVHKCHGGRLICLRSLPLTSG